ncbi:MAG TPA: hypothetical protein VI911_10975 [Patescibacteria group bacterium]|nr:hypothetical protein [Patescibacteria group bacterium]
MGNLFTSLLKSGVKKITPKVASIRSWANKTTESFSKITKTKVQSGKLNFESNKFQGVFFATPTGKFLSGAGRLGRSLGKASIGVIKTGMKVSTFGLVPHALTLGALGTGVAYGAGRAIINRSNERTMNMANKGMSPNNLGTDGLTLALSKRRHRG